MTTEGVDVSGLRKIYMSAEGAGGGIRDANFQLQEGTFFTLLGPSGCGKTTTLRCIAGLERPDAGRIDVGGATFFDSAENLEVQLNRRKIGMVFQSYAIWPHMTVFENVSFPLRVAKDQTYRRDEVERMTRKALRTVDLEEFGSRSATRLSGGQQQRVALARAIVREPKLLLLDEPLSNLDATLRESMRTELKRLQRQIGVTTIYVTHDQAEALEMSDKIAVINQGEVVQIDSPEGVYYRPRNAFVAGFVGHTNLLEGTAQTGAREGAMASIVLRDGTCLRCLSTREVRADEAVTVSIRPESIAFTLGGSELNEKRNRLSGCVERRGFIGNMNRYNVRVGSHDIAVNTHPSVSMAAEDDVVLHFSEDDAIVLGN